MLTIHRLALDEEGAYPHAERLGIGQADAPVPARHERIEMCLEIEALDEVVDERQCPQALTVKLERVGLEGGLTGLHLSFILTPEQSPVNHRISRPMENTKPNRRRLRQRTLALRRAINAMDFIVTGTLLMRTGVRTGELSLR